MSRDIDWRSRRRQALEKARRVVVKVGSAVLTTDKGLDPRVINRLADQMAALHDRGLDLILVTSGAVAAGRHVLGEDPACMVHKQAASAVGQSRLMHGYDEAFGRYGKITAQILLTRDDLRSRERFLNARNTMSRLLEWRVIPIVNENDTVAVQELKFGDNDALSAMVANLVEADLVVNLTSAPGVFSDNPLTNPDAVFVPYIEDIAGMNLQTMCRGKTGAGTGGMLSKLMAARGSADTYCFRQGKVCSGAHFQSGGTGHLDRPHRENVDGPEILAGLSSGSGRQHRRGRGSRPGASDRGQEPAGSRSGPRGRKFRRRRSGEYRRSGWRLRGSGTNQFQGGGSAQNSGIVQRGD